MRKVLFLCVLIFVCFDSYALSSSEILTEIIEQNSREFINTEGLTLTVQDLVNSTWVQINPFSESVFSEINSMGTVKHFSHDSYGYVFLPDNLCLIISYRHFVIINDNSKNKGMPKIMSYVDSIKVHRVIKYTVNGDKIYSDKYFEGYMKENYLYLNVHDRGFIKYSLKDLFPFYEYEKKTLWHRFYEDHYNLYLDSTK